MATSKAKHLFRLCLREALKHDRHPASKAMLSPNVFNRALEPYAALHSVKDQFVKKLFTSGQYYRPNVRLTEIVKDILRETDDKDHKSLNLLDEDHRSFMIRLSRVLNRNNGMAKGFKLTEDVSISESPLRTNLSVSPLLNPTPPSVGSILVAHPLIQSTQRFAIVIITEIGNETGGKTKGLVVNAQTVTRVRHQRPDMESGTKTLVSVFGEQKTFQGGNGDRKLYVIHPFEEIPDSKKLLPGVFLNGDAEVIADMISSQKAKPEDFKILVGQHTWHDYDQLCDEIIQNKWIQMDGNSPDISVVPLAQKQAYTNEGYVVPMTKRSWGDVMLGFGGEFSAFERCVRIPQSDFNGLSAVARRQKNWS